MISRFSAAACALLLFGTLVAKADAGSRADVSSISSLVTDAREAIGQPLLDWAVKANNSRAIILHRLTPEGAYFALANKSPGEAVDTLRQRTPFAFFVTSCSGSKDLSGKISAVNLWETIRDEQQPLIGIALQQLLEKMNTPPGIQTPSAMRAPRTNQLNGVVFEYARGDTVETVSLVNEATTGLRLNYFISNTAICPK